MATFVSTDLIPALNLAGIPDEEQVPLFDVINGLMALRDYENEFRAALALFDLCSANLTDPSQPFWKAWLQLSAREGGMCIYHFGKVVEGIRATLSRCATFKEKLDNEALRNAGALLDDKFPARAGIRRAISHRGQAASDPNQRRLHFVKGPVVGSARSFGSKDTTIALRGVISGREVHYTNRGKAHVYEMSDRTAQDLRNIRLAFYSGFAPVSQSSRSPVPTE